MNMIETVVLNGNDLSIEDIVYIGVGDKNIKLCNEALKRCKASRAFLAKAVFEKRIIYGVNTSFGPMCSKIIHDDEIETLQVNLIRSHAAGLGEPLKPYIALAALSVRLNSLVKGFSGVRVELLEHLKLLINKRIAPYIPECGSVGASGDLIHLAHLALTVIGEGKSYYMVDGTWRLYDTAELFKKLDITPFKLSFKEGIALMNGTSVMSAIAAFAIFGAEKLFNIACVNAAFGMEIFGGIDDAFDEDLHFVKPHPGQIKVASIIRKLYDGSKNITLRKNVHDNINAERDNETPVYETDINVQDVYSIRCTPQILAPVAETIDFARQTILTEVNSSNDNPIVIPDKKKIIHGGNFHGQSVAFAMDSLCMAIAEICNLSERRINKLLDKNLNEGLPEHLIAGTAGLNMGFMGAQYLATSTTAENRQLANPVGTLSISCNASNQDVVSMGTVAARKTLKSVSNAKHVVTLEILADLQALSFRNADSLGLSTSEIYNILNKDFSVYDNSEIFHIQLVKFRKLLFSTSIFDDLSIYFPESS
jgi:histidine ammonia-lyase